jgi:flagellar basal-body rod protein FlgB
MAITDIPILSILRMRLEWAQSRQKVLAQNVANADTPITRRAIWRGDIRNAVRSPARAAVPTVSLARTESGHLAGFAGSGSGFREIKAGYEVKPTGNPSISKKR